MLRACCRGLLAGLSGELGDAGAAVDAEAEPAWVAEAEVLDALDADVVLDAEVPRFDDATPETRA